jgi:single-strand DNA-binding protein
MNTYNCIGNLGKDPEVKYFENGNRVSNFSVAVRGYKDDTLWLDCEAWNKTADIMADYCKKGTKVGLTGSFKTQKWVDKETGKERSKLVLNVSQLTLLGSKSDSQTNHDYDPF